MAPPHPRNCSQRPGQAGPLLWHPRGDWGVSQYAAAAQRDELKRPPPSLPSSINLTKNA